ncbi:MAG TPA: IspD/TarI family cytidylyltransferase [Lachnospiraceae bacterium]|nr:IspD/TarI family cytidylyltransferase [Lachnospiraceae bacterium]
MNYCIILSGGVGSRMKMGNTPKQYLMVDSCPVIGYSLRTFEENNDTDGILIVSDPAWQSFLNEWIGLLKITKFIGFAPSGESRQNSIWNGLEALKKRARDSDAVIIHDAARPCVKQEMISACLDAIPEHDGAMPVVSVKDTCYLSKDGKKIDGEIPRNEIFAGQSPESFIFGKYYAANKAKGPEHLGSVHGSTEIAYEAGMDICLLEGSESNLKITTKEDLELFESISLKRYRKD